MKTNAEWMEDIQNEKISIELSYKEFKEILLESASEAQKTLGRRANVHDVIRHSGSRFGFNKSTEYARAWKRGEVQ